MKATICGLVFLLLGTGFVLGQNPGGHIHQNHPTTDHQNGWHRISIADGPTNPLVEPNPVETLVVLVDQDFVNQNCEPSAPSVSVTREVGHSTEVGGSITVGGSVEAAAGALFAKCKAEAHADVEINASFKSHKTVTIAISDSTTLPKCRGISYNFTIQAFTANGEIDTFDHKMRCQYLQTTEFQSTYCNQTKLTGTAAGWGSTSSGWINPIALVPCGCDEIIPPVGGGSGGGGN